MHDLDYEKFPEQHCQKSREILFEHLMEEGERRSLRLPGRQGVGLIPLHTRRVQNRKGDGNGI